MIQQNGSGTVGGQITINAVADDGSGTLQLSHAAAMMSSALDYCPYPSPLPDAQQNACTTITAFTTDVAGAATVKFQFPQNGTWAGVFAVVRDNTAEFVSGFNAPGSGMQYRSSLKQASSINSGTAGETPGGDALKHGSVTVTDSTAHIALENATTDVTYTIIFCRNGGGSSCYQVGAISTDSTGSGASDIDLVKILGTLDNTGIFRLNRTYTLSNGTQVPAVQFMTAFVSGCQQTRCE